MAEELQTDKAEALRRLLDSGTLPASLTATAETLLRQLTQPVRLTLLGAPQAGKSALANLLLASPVLAADLRLPTVQIVWGDDPTCICTLSDGSTRRFDHVDMPAIAALTPAMVTLELPLPALRKISILELAAPSTAADMQRALHWAAGRTDIALWCSQRFGPAEQAIWSGAQDAMKDHAFLVLTKSDLLGESRAAVLTEVQERVKSGGDLFRHVLAVATHQAIAARRKDGNIDRDALTRSGGRALIAAILREVDSGRQAASDRADILLQQYRPQVVAPAPVTTTVPPAAVAAPLPVPAPVPAPVLAADPAPPPSSEPPLAFTRPAPATAKPRPALSSVTRTTYEQAIARLVRHGRVCSAEMQPPVKPDLARLETETAQTLHWLSEHLNENGDPRDRHLTRMREAAFDATDLVQLMRLEKNPATLTESLSLMLQLKREMETCLSQIGAAFAPGQALTA